MKKSYLLAGTWGSHTGDDQGISLFRWEDGKDLTFLSQTDPEVSAGALAYDPSRKMLYAVDECENKKGEKGGGGFVRAYQLDTKAEKLIFVNEINVLMPKPCYLALDPLGEYLLVACHSSRNAVTKVGFNSRGEFIPTVIYDDAGIVMLKLEADGSLGRIADVALHQGLSASPRQVIAHPHSINGAPGQDFFLACDKGIDRLFVYGMDRAHEKLVLKSTRPMEEKTAPRYSAYHPSLPVVYENNETGNKLYAFAYEAESGAMKEISCAETCSAAEAMMGPSDLKVSPDGRFLYASIRGVNKIVRFALRADGSLGGQTDIPSPVSPRGLVFSPDGRQLFVSCPEEGTISAWQVAESGDLSGFEKKAEVPHAAFLFFINT